MNRGNARQRIFDDRDDYEDFIELLAKAGDHSRVPLLAFCLMPNHWHLVLWPTSAKSLSSYMHWLTSTHVLRLHRPVVWLQGLQHGDEPAGGEAMLAIAERLAVGDLAPLLDRITVLIVPRAHVPTLSDMPAGELGTLFAAVQRVARAVESGLGADGTFVAMNNKVSQSVPHLHVHVVPRRKKDGLRGFFWPRVAYADDAEREAFAEKIRGAIVRSTDE